ncbi:MAG: hypothetical protein AAB584_01390 [Patescibacteria group bacterium]
MNKTALSFKLSIVFLREGNSFIAYSPALDLSTSASSFEKARTRFAEAAKLFFEEVIKKGTINEVLQELGWQKHNKEWQPPLIVSQETESIRVPVVL